MQRVTNTGKTIDIDLFMAALQAEYPGWKAPVVTLIANRGATPFEILVSTLLSLRTKDEVTAEATGRLLAVVRTPEETIRLTEPRIRELIYPVGFYPTKAARLMAICRLLIAKHEGRVPDTMKDLLSLPGVGRKTANLVLAEGFGKKAMCVDTHVHRISNRIGYVQTTMPEKTEFALRGKLPDLYWSVYNELLVAFGQTVCRPISPWCSRCPVVDMCPRKGVRNSR